MPVKADAPITITAFDWVPDFARGQVRDLRVRWALEEVGQDYAVRCLPQGQQKEAAHRALQPFGQVPTYEEGDLTLFAALNTLEPPIMDRSMATIFEATEPWSALRLPGIDSRIEERLQEASDRLGPAEWCTGRFSVGDLMMVSVLRIIEGEGLIETFPNLADYVARGTERPAFQRALAAQMAGFTGNPPPGFDAWIAEFQAIQGETT